MYMYVRRNDERREKRKEEEKEKGACGIETPNDGECERERECIIYYALSGTSPLKC